MVYHMRVGSARGIDVYFIICYMRYIMITGMQIRMARSALRWTAQELAEKAGIGWATVQRMEQGDDVPTASAKNLDAVQRALETGGVAFINDGRQGVQLRRQK